jgi:hypothetical protein
MMAIPPDQCDTAPLFLGAVSVISNPSSEPLERFGHQLRQGKRENVRMRAVSGATLERPALKRLRRPHLALCASIIDEAYSTVRVRDT